jgi:bacteriocin biosynthesis cyclodehydratase domain-containing protein
MNVTAPCAGRRVHILSVGAFGQAIAASLQTLLPNVRESRVDANGQTHPMFWPQANVHLLATWRPTTRLSRLLNEMSYAWRTPFIEAVLETPQLRVGPVVVPGASACYDCFAKRMLQHAQRPAEYQALRAFYDANPTQGPQGFLPAVADLAAIRLAQLVQALERDANSVAGQIWHLNTMQRDTAQSTVVGVHGCVHCGLGQDEATRGYQAMQHELNWLFPVTN